MKSFLIVLAILLCVSPVFGEAMLIFEGPTSQLPLGPGKFKIDVYGQNITDFAAIQTVLEFREQPGNALSDDFQISIDSGNPVFGGQAIWPNAVQFPVVFPAYIDDSGNVLYRQLAGFMLMSGKTDLTGKKLLQSIWYDYTASASGSYRIGINSAETLISDSNALAVSYQFMPDDIVITAVPEPNAILILGIGLISFLFCRWRKR